MTLFKYIEDADLWRWQLLDSKQFHAGLGEMRLEYDVTKNPAIFDQLCRLKAADIINKVTVATYQIVLWPLIINHYPTLCLITVPNLVPGSDWF